MSKPVVNVSLAKVDVNGLFDGSFRNSSSEGHSNALSVFMGLHFKP